MLGDLHGVERRAHAEVVGAAEERERVGAAGHLADPADERDVQTRRLERARIDVVRGIVAELDAGRRRATASRASSGVIARSNSATSTTA